MFNSEVNKIKQLSGGIPPQTEDVNIYSIKNHKDYPALITELSKQQIDISEDAMAMIDDLNNQIVDLALRLKYYNVPDSPEYKELLYKYNRDVPKLYLPKQYPTSITNNINVKQSQPLPQILSNRDNKHIYDLTNWSVPDNKTIRWKSDSINMPLNENRLELLNNHDTYPY